MELSLIIQPQLFAWLLGLFYLIFGLYILALNAWHSANRHTSALLLSLAVNSFAVALLRGAQDQAQAQIPTLILAAMGPALGPASFLVALALLKPDWLSGRSRRVWWLVYAITLLPLLLTVSDLVLGTQLWYTGLTPASYRGGYAPRAQFLGGQLSPLLWLFDLFPLLSLVPLLHDVFRENPENIVSRQLAWSLIGLLVVAAGAQFGLANLLGEWPARLTGGAVLAAAYVYAALRQILTERRRQRGRLPIRLTVIILAATLPLTVAVALFISNRAGALIRNDAIERLESTNRALASNISLWLDLNANALEELSSLPEIQSMDPEQQKPLLKAMAEAYPHMYLVSTTDWFGENVARSDDQPLQNYRGELWHTNARNGAALTYDVFVDPATGHPALAASVPIRQETQAFSGIAGVLMFASDLAQISREVKASAVGETGTAYVVDAQNKVVAHTDPTLSAELQDYDTYPPVFSMRGGASGGFTFVDEEGQRWYAVVDVLENGWGVVVQQQEAELLSATQLFQRISWVAIALAGILLSALASLSIYQAVQPIASLTETATAIAGGDLSRVAPIESDDEIGVLAQAFNSMTEQLRSLIGSLEERVAERTRDLEHRTAQLEAASQVAQAAAAIRDVDRLLDATVHLISDRFGFYHAGIFLLDEAGQFAVLRAASSQGGQRMLSRGHRLKVGEVGIVGYAAGVGEARIALDVGADAVYFNNPDLPETRSEMAVPMKVRDEVIGVLDVQAKESGTFSEDDIAMLQTLANQVALAIENARLLEEAEERLREVNLLLGGQSRSGWHKLSTERPEWGYAYDGTDVVPISSGRKDEPGAELAVPLRVREDAIGQLKVMLDGRELSPSELEVVEAVVEEASVALENARLFYETQRTLQEVEALNTISSTVSRSLQLEDTLQTSLRQALDITGLEAGLISLASLRTGELVLTVHKGLPKIMIRNLSLSGMSDTLCDLVYQRGEAISLENLVDAPLDAEGLMELGLHSYVGVPLESRGEAVGTLCAFGYTPRTFAPETISLLQAAGQQIGVAVENAQLFQSARRRAERERTIADITARLRASTDVDRILQTAIQELARALGASDGVIRLEVDNGSGPRQPATEEVEQ
ncbi:MAG: GAF domain-containing protein [Anaerolineae bacterium]|jgi:GAF domain-containing protein/HAMP domain-containing protein